MEPREKAQWRQSVLTERGAISEQTRSTESSALTAHSIDLTIPGTTVCAYVPTRTEPGTTDLLDALAAVVDRVLLPITGTPGPLSWVEYTGVDALRPAAYGLREPVGPVLPPETVALAHTIFVPALAVDLHGTRLGRGAGYYDRTLGLASPTARLVAVVRDSELVERLPADPHDIPMGWALTPTAGWTRLGR
ncbi:5-formyltetrahydrofolate cyclo-ligase [Rhodococcus sp. KBS0724]|uniref:5-formyltetrahydrofolate cyclo-ligase n=1 Tax=Rhodococcus sp. KBS0724 TaxID=1179674 RepID=UPI00110E9519|nr:5-formyltetrahydrofolate cyclo-ligase [Rhodococcus sp. KBS0724]TSD45966.1 5-formyltetrahydrofolate cyclo-ligase [Rhodococcus sp. KBS0724]